MDELSQRCTFSVWKFIQELFSELHSTASKLAAEEFKAERPRRVRLFLRCLVCDRHGNTLPFTT
jgi:hypothetical protein